MAKEWFFYQAWAGLPESVGDGHARIAPWRDRLAADPGRCQAIVAAAAGLLAPGDTLLVYEWALDDDGDGPPAVALFDLMMLVENEGGAAWPAAQLTSWPETAGLTGIRLRRGAPIAVLRATAPRP